MPTHIPGPAGQLEAMLTHASTDNKRYAVLCHPHPQFGGSMYDAVLDTVQRALLATGTHCLRFNFRGVGASEGTHDEGVGEIDDVAAALTWVRNEHAPQHLTLGGYSFGAAMAWHALDRIIEPDRMVLVAPPIGVMTLPERVVNCRVDVITGAADQFVDPAALADWQGVNVHSMAAADHFFTGQAHALERRLPEILQAS